MSLPGSQRIVGTDGSDFQHRERIATHYRISAETKTRLRLLIYLHFISIEVCVTLTNDKELNSMEIN